MFGSAALETAIGLSAMFFILATAASAITEWVSRVTNKRARDLELALGALLTGERLKREEGGARQTLSWIVEQRGKLRWVKKRKDTNATVATATAVPAGTPAPPSPASPSPAPPSPALRPLDDELSWLKETSVWRAAEASAGVRLFRRGVLKRPNYLSAKMFADAVVELLTKHPLEPKAPTTAQSSAPEPVTTVSSSIAEWPKNLEARINVLVAEGRHDLLSFKAGMEGWFDEAMKRAEGAYKRWATLILFAIGLGLAIGLNLSTIQTATVLWQQPATREAVANASAKLLEDDATAKQIKGAGTAQDTLDALKIPGGWSAANDEAWALGWKKSDVTTWDVTKVFTAAHGDRRLYDLIGWLLTAFLVMLGAPFWFDVLGKLVSIRGTGAKPPTADQDDSSATKAAASAGAAEAAVTSDGGHVAPTPAGPATLTFAQRVGLLAPPESEQSQPATEQQTAPLAPAAPATSSVHAAETETDETRADETGAAAGGGDVASSDKTPPEQQSTTEP